MIWTGVAFFLTAAAYAAVGFGGGSTYAALLALAEVDYRALPIIALACNMIVASSGAIYYWRRGAYRNADVPPLILFSAPAAFLGGLTPIAETAFFAVLAALLAIGGVDLARQAVTPAADVPAPRARRSTALAAMIGAVIGYISGLAGVGGGIILAPVLHAMRWSHARSIAAIASLYIAVNSAAALAGKTLRVDDIAWADILAFWPAPLAVFIGGVIGRRLSFKLMSDRALKGATALLVLIVAGRILFRLAQGTAE